MQVSFFNMAKFSIAAVLTLLFASTQTANGQVILVGPENSKIEFTISHLGVLSVDGSFTNFSGTISIKDKRWDMSGTIQVNSIFTGNPERDQTIKTEQYMNATNFPEIKFIGSGIENQDKIKVTGNLTLKKVTRPITFTLSREKKHFIAERFIIKRSEFNLTFGGMDALVGDEIEVKLKMAMN